MSSLRRQLITGRFGRVVQEIVYERPYAYDGSWDPWRRVVVGRDVSLVNTYMNAVSGEIRIGDYSYFGSGVSLLTGTHNHRLPDRKARTSASPTTGRDIVIGTGVCGASNATILGPCRIGDDSLIAAGAVVVSLPEIPARSLVAGVPARVIGTVEPEPARPS